MIEPLKFPAGNRHAPRAVLVKVGMGEITCKDPCDFVLRFGGKAFEKLLDNATPAIDHRFNLLMEEFLGAGPNARAVAIRKSIEWFATFVFFREPMDPPQRGQIYIQLATLSGLTVPEVRHIIDARIAMEAAPPSFKFPMPGTNRTNFEASAFGAIARDDGKRRAALDALDACDDEPWEQP